MPLTRRLRLAGGWFAAFLFALHPVGVESVAWIAEQKNTLSTALALGAAIAYLDFDEGRGGRRYALALGLFALAVLGKTAVATVPAVLLVVIWWRRGALGRRRDVAPMLPWFVLSAAAALATWLVERKLMAGVGGVAPLSLAGRVALAGRIFWFYLGKLAWPARLTFFYPQWTVDASAAWPWLFPLAAVALGAGLAFHSRRRRGPLACYLCFAGLLFPVLGFFRLEWFVFSYVGDHLQYLPSLAILLPLAAVAWPRLKRVPGGIALGGAVLGLLGGLAWHQCLRYADPETFYRTAVEMNPASGAAYDNLGAVLAAQPARRPEAIAAFQAGLRLAPNSYLAHEDLGLAWSRTPGHLEDAVAEYREALRLKPDFAEAHNDLGLALAQAGRLDEAIAQFREALRLKPDLPGAHNNLGLAWTVLGRNDDAIAQFRETLRLAPDFAPAWHSLGMAFYRAGDRPAAADAFRRELELAPGNAAARQALDAVSGR